MPDAIPLCPRTLTCGTISRSARSKTRSWTCPRFGSTSCLLPSQRKATSSWSCALARRDRHRRSRDARRSALERGKRREHQGQQSIHTSAPAAYWFGRRPVRGSPRPDGRSREAQQRSQGRNRDSALFDAVGRTLGIACRVQLLGGVVREERLCFGRWPRVIPPQEIEEAEKKIARRSAHTFKVKIGARIARSRHGSHAAPRRRAGRSCRADRGCESGMGRNDGVALPADTRGNWCHPIEQPLPAWNIQGMARLRTRSTVPLMADECVFSTHDMLGFAQAGAADVVSP